MAIATFLKLNKIPVLFSVLCAFFYASFAYDLDRTDFIKLAMLYGALFFLSYKLVQICRDNFRFLVYLSVAFRLVFIFSIPNLSQDFYRFVWDGRMLLNGLNPYLFTPQSLIEMGQLPFVQAQELYDGMGMLNASHFTNYPPIKQLVFVIAAIVSGKSILGSVIVMRLFLIAADLGTLYFGKKLLEKLQMPTNAIFWFVLNPFVIIELTGNLHFEGLMVFFLVWGLYMVHIGKWQFAALVFGLSISVKLVPLLFLPLFIGWFGQKEKGYLHLVLFYLITVLTVVLTFLPFVSTEMLNHYMQTSSLWLNKFEFNAGLYYIARSIGFAVTGYNAIAIIGKVMLALLVVIVLSIALFRKTKTLPELASSMLFAMTAYLFLSTTVHPWYLATALALCVFTVYKYPLAWSLVVFLSYLAYMNPDYKENLCALAIEYVVVYGFFVWEVFFKKRFSF